LVKFLDWLIRVDFFYCCLLSQGRVDYLDLNKCSDICEAFVCGDKKGCTVRSVHLWFWPLEGSSTKLNNPFTCTIEIDTTKCDEQNFIKLF